MDPRMTLVLPPSQAGEKDKEDNSLDVIGPEDGSTIVNSELANLKRELVGRQSAGQMDGFAYYL